MSRNIPLKLRLSRKIREELEVHPWMTNPVANQTLRPMINSFMDAIWHDDDELIDIISNLTPDGGRQRLKTFLTEQAEGPDITPEGLNLMVDSAMGIIRRSALATQNLEDDGLDSGPWTYILKDIYEIPDNSLVGRAAKILADVGVFPRADPNLAERGVPPGAEFLYDARQYFGS